MGQDTTWRLVECDCGRLINLSPAFHSDRVKCPECGRICKLTPARVRQQTSRDIAAPEDGAASPPGPRTSLRKPLLFAIAAALALGLVVLAYVATREPEDRAAGPARAQVPAKEKPARVGLAQPHAPQVAEDDPAEVRVIKGQEQGGIPERAEVARDANASVEQEPGRAPDEGAGPGPPAPAAKANLIDLSDVGTWQTHRGDGAGGAIQPASASWAAVDDVLHGRTDWSYLQCPVVLPRDFELRFRVKGQRSSLSVSPVVDPPWRTREAFGVQFNYLSSGTPRGATCWVRHGNAFSVKDAPVQAAPSGGGEWNTVKLVSKGGRLWLSVNGHVAFGDISCNLEGANIIFACGHGCKAVQYADLTLTSPGGAPPDAAGRTESEEAEPAPPESGSKANLIDLSDVGTWQTYRGAPDRIHRGPASWEANNGALRGTTGWSFLECPVDLPEESEFWCNFRGARATVFVRDLSVGPAEGKGREEVSVQLNYLRRPGMNPPGITLRLQHQGRTLKQEGIRGILRPEGQWNRVGIVRVDGKVSLYVNGWVAIRRMPCDLRKAHAFFGCGNGCNRVEYSDISLVSLGSE